MNDTRRGFRLIVTAVLAAVALSGCFLQLTTPGIELTVDPAYNDWEILIPYSLWGSGSTAHGRWSLRRYDPVTDVWVEHESREVRLPNGSSGVLQLRKLDEGRYELTFELMTTRDGSYQVVPYLTERREFYVDRTPPDPVLGLFVNPPGGNHLASTSLFVQVDYNQFADPNRLSDQRALVVVGETRPPMPEQDENFSSYQVWDAGVAPGTVYLVTIVIIDEAGNRSEIIFGTNLLQYTAQ